MPELCLFEFSLPTVSSSDLKIRLTILTVLSPDRISHSWRWFLFEFWHLFLKKKFLFDYSLFRQLCFRYTMTSKVGKPIKIHAARFSFFFIRSNISNFQFKTFHSSKILSNDITKIYLTISYTMVSLPEIQKHTPPLAQKSYLC